MLRGKASTQYKWCTSRSNRSSGSTPPFFLPRVHGEGGPDAGRSNGLKRLNGLNYGPSAASDQGARASICQIFPGVTIVVLILFAAGCDPVVNIGGTFFPGWMVAILIGSALTVAIRYLFVFTGLEPHVGPLALIYTSLGMLLSVVSWLILYRS